MVVCAFGSFIVVLKGLLVVLLRFCSGFMGFIVVFHLFVMFFGGFHN